MTTAAKLMDLCESVAPKQAAAKYAASFSKDGITANFSCAKEGTWKLEETLLNGKDKTSAPLWDKEVVMPTKPDEIKALMAKHGYEAVDTGTNSMDIADDTKEIMQKVK